MQRRVGHGFAIASVALGCASLTACGGGDDEGPTSVPTSVAFEVQVNHQSFACGHTYADVGARAADFSITDARFYVSNIELLEPSGKSHPLVLDENAFQSQGLALIDAEDGCGPDGTPETHTTVTGFAPALAYERVRFTLGVPKERNFIDLASATPPLDVTSMFWVWQSGYKFLKVDGASPAVDGGINPFFVHLGSSGCPGENPSAPPTADCSSPNRVTYELAGFSPSIHKVIADVGELLAASDVSTNTEGTPPGCMSVASDPECVTLFPRLGVDAPSEQHLFHVE